MKNCLKKKEGEDQTLGSIQLPEKSRERIWILRQNISQFKFKKADQVPLKILFLFENTESNFLTPLGTEVFGF